MQGSTTGRRKGEKTSGYRRGSVFPPMQPRPSRFSVPPSPGSANVPVGLMVGVAGPAPVFSSAGTVGGLGGKAGNNLGEVEIRHHFDGGKM